MMAESFVAVQLPAHTYHRLEQVAKLTYRSVEDVLNTTLNANLPPAKHVSESVSAELSKMNYMSDAALFSTMQSTLSLADQQRLKYLTELAKSQRLTQEQRAEHKRLLDTNELAVLRRAKAMAVLSQRGHAVFPEIDLTI